MICIHCGAEVPDNASFCAKCGQRLNMPGSAEPVSAAPAKKPGLPRENPFAMADDSFMDKTVMVNPQLAESLLADPFTRKQAVEDIPLTEPVRDIPFTAPIEPLPSFEASTASDGKPGKDRKRWKPPVILIVVLVLLLLLAGAVAALVLSGEAAALLSRLSPSASNAKPVSLAGVLDVDGMAYVPMPDGTAVTIDDEVTYTVLTPDREHIVVLLEDGTLYVTDPQQKSQHIVSEDCQYLSVVQNDGLFYWDTDDTLYRVSFAGYASLELPDVVNFTVAPNTISVLYTDTDGGIYALPADSQAIREIGSFEERAYVQAISDDGQTAVWVCQDPGAHAVCIHEGQELFELTDTDCGQEYCCYAGFSGDQKALLVTHSGEEHMWIKETGKEPVTLKLGSDTFSYSIFTDDGGFYDSKASDALYVSVLRDTEYNVYRFTTDGNRERILPGVYGFVVSNGTIFYVEDGGTLKYAKLKDGALAEETRIAKDVSYFYVFGNGKYVYYFRDVENSMGTLYCYHVDSGDSRKIASDVYVDSSLRFNASADGKTVLFWKDVGKINQTDLGTLMMWTYGEDDPVFISEDVLYLSATSGLSNEQILPDSFLFMKFGFKATNGNIISDWMYYNGEKAAQLASDIIS